MKKVNLLITFLVVVTAFGLMLPAQWVHAQDIRRELSDFGPTAEEELRSYGIG